MLLYKLLSVVYTNVVGGFVSASTYSDEAETFLFLYFAIIEAAAVAFGVLYYKNKNEAEEGDKMISRLSSENFDLRLQMEKRESRPGELIVPLSTENIAEFLRNEKASEVYVSDNSDAIFYSVTIVR